MNEIYNIIQKITNTSSTNDKIKIIKENVNNELFKDIINMTYNTDFNFYIANVDSFSTIGTSNIVDMWSDIFDLLNNLMNRVITGNTAREAVDIVGCKLDKESQEIFINILKRDLRCNIGVSLINKAFGKNFLPDFKVQLANKYDENKKYKNKYWYATPKLDGIRAFWNCNCPDSLYSRQGKEFVGMEHIIEDLNKIRNLYPDITFIDGELYSKDIEFNEIQGVVMATVNYNSDAKSKIRFNVFACGSDNFKTTEDMQKAIEDFINDNNKHKLFNTLDFVQAVKIDNNAEKIKDLARQFVEQGYEGIMLRNPDVYYDFKRSNNLIKFKFFSEMDLTIVGMVAGEGKYSNTMGNIICEGYSDGGKIIKTECGSGFSDEDRDYFWKNKDTFVGKLAEIKYQEISQNSDGNFSLRFPIYRRLKMDRG